MQPPPLAAATRVDQVQVWVTTADRRRLLEREHDLALAGQPLQPLLIDVNEHKRYQEMVGFGAAVTDATATVLDTLLKPAQRKAALRELFGPPPGIGLSFVRVPIGASDFSSFHYSLDDRPPGETDPTLAHFALDANHTLLTPLLRAARSINPQLKIVASPWSAPGWMKDSGNLVGGTLLPNAYGAFADYLLRYVDASAQAGVPIYALTVQNEPGFEPTDYPGMLFDPAARARFIADYLGPRLAARKHAPLILDWDHNWDKPEAPLHVLANGDAARYIAGVAWHCYYGDVRAQDQVHEAFPSKDAYLTECSGGGWSPHWSEALRQFVGQLMIGSTRAWARGVILWNLALDEHHGPHAGGCKNCRGVITVDSATGQVTRNVEYYSLAHLSRFVRPGAHRIESSEPEAGLQNVAFRNTDDGSLVLLVLNGSSEERSFSVRNDGRNFSYQLPPGAVATFCWRPAGVASPRS
ncbi:MAG: glycosyl hydrolase [Gammaproteobacteria bacterium]|nr:glycosyl hydrolase [Gammaproteobacteria bacterium]MDE2251441.1 glycosyl hydrolase [Gammaproteobacteria bacterium]